jgi:hypothetical protein
MTVKEAIELLKKQPEDAIIIIDQLGMEAEIIEGDPLEEGIVVIK